MRTPAVATLSSKTGADRNARTGPGKRDNLQSTLPPSAPRDRRPPDVPPRSTATSAPTSRWSSTTRSTSAAWRRPRRPPTRRASATTSCAGRSAAPSPSTSRRPSRPTPHNRWMGSAAMDGSGNLAVGYSVSSSTLAPVDPLRGPPRHRSAERPVPGRGHRHRRHRRADQHGLALGRLQRPLRRPGGRLHVLVHHRVLHGGEPGDQHGRLADPHRHVHPRRAARRPRTARSRARCATR